MGNQNSVYTVSQLNGFVKRLMDTNETLSAVYVQGELTNYKVYPSGHYFSLKDEKGVLHCLMFAGETSTLRFEPQNGMQVIAFGRVTVYPKDGKYQLYVSRMVPNGVGDLQQAYERLRARLEAQGLFDEDHKKPIPRYPMRLALVTSPVGSVVWDMIHALQIRWPMARVYVVPCRVQGEGAAQEIAGAISWVNAWKLADLIITGRGGGSREELWCFNEEVVARAIYDSDIPVISAVGHDPDVTISDFVADLRAGTPSKAAVQAVPDQRELYTHLDHLKQRMGKAVERQLLDRKALLAQLGRCPMLRDPQSWVRDRRGRLDRQKERLRYTMAAVLADRRRNMAALAAGLDAMSPLKVLGRGYAIAKGPNGILKSKKDAHPGDQLTLQLSDGAISCTVDQ